MDNNLARRLIADASAHPDFRDKRRRNIPAYVIDLSILRDALGAKWGDYADAVHRITARTIERHLDEAHSCVQRADCYLLNFNGATPLAALEKVQTIANAVAAALFTNDKFKSASRPRHDKPQRMSRVAVLRMNGLSLSDQAKLLVVSVQEIVRSLFSADDRVVRRGLWNCEAPEPLIAATAATTDAGAPRFDSPLIASPRSILADPVSPSRSAASGSMHHPAANDDDLPIPGHAGIGSAPYRRIAADFRSPSQPTSAGEVDLDQTDALESAMKAIVERLAQDSERSASATPYRQANR